MTIPAASLCLTTSYRRIAVAVATFSEREIAILRERFFADQPVTLEDLAQRFGLTRERVRQIGNAHRLSANK